MSKGYAKRYFFGIGQSDAHTGFRMAFSTPWPEWARWEYWRGFHAALIRHLGPNELAYNEAAPITLEAWRRLGSARDRAGK